MTTCSHGAIEAICGVCGLIEMENFHAPRPDDRELTLERAAEMFPDAVVMMDWSIPNILTGQNVRMRGSLSSTFLSKQGCWFSISCDATEEQRQRRIEYEIRRWAYNNRRDDMDRERARRMGNRYPVSASWDFVARVWRRMNVGVKSHPRRASPDRPEISVRRVREDGAIVDCLPTETVMARGVRVHRKVEEQLRGHRADQLFIDDVPGYNKVDDGDAP